MILSRTVLGFRLGHQRALDAAFFLGVPLILTLHMAVVGRYVDVLGVKGGLLYVAALSFVPWWMAGVATQIARAATKTLPLPLWAVCVLGVLASAPFVSLYAHEVHLWFVRHWPGGTELRSLAMPDSWDRARDVLLSTGRALALWVSFVLVFESTLGWSRYARAEPEDPKVNQPRPDRLTNSGASWTPEDDHALAALVQKGVDPADIARGMKRTAPAIRARMKRLKLRPPADQA